MEAMKKTGKRMKSKNVVKQVEVVTLTDSDDDNETNQNVDPLADDTETLQESTETEPPNKKRLTSNVNGTEKSPLNVSQTVTLEDRSAFEVEAESPFKTVAALENGEQDRESGNSSPVPIAALECSQGEEESEPSVSLESVITVVEAGASPEHDKSKQCISIPAKEDHCNSTNNTTQKPQASTSQVKPKTCSRIKAEERPNAGKRVDDEVEKLLKAVSKRIKPAELVEVEGKIRQSIRKLNLTSSSEEFEAKMAESIHKIMIEIALANDKVWGPLKRLLDYLKAREGGENSGEIRQKRKEKKIKLLEARLKEIERLIEAWDKKDDNWDDDYNSPYLTKDRLVNRFMKYYNMLCEYANCNTLTGRPTQRKIETSGIITYNEITTAIDSYLNSKDSLFIPDFPEILKIVQDVSKTQLHLDDETVHRCAKVLFENIVKEVKKRRIKDLHGVLPTMDKSDDEDPADKDPELAAKLKENESKRRKEADILKEFAERQTALNEEPVEVEDENIDDSPDETEDEEEEEEVEDEDDDNYDNTEEINDLPNEIGLQSDSAEDSSEEVEEEQPSSASQSGIKRSASALKNKVPPSEDSPVSNKIQRIG